MPGAEAFNIGLLQAVSSNSKHFHLVHHNIAKAASSRSWPLGGIGRPCIGNSQKSGFSRKAAPLPRAVYAVAPRHTKGNPAL